jgi:hypothetical protein
LTPNVFPFDGRYVGRLLVNGTGKPSEILTRLNKLAGYNPDEEIRLYEVGLCCDCCLIFYLSVVQLHKKFKIVVHPSMFRSHMLRYQARVKR